MNSNLTPAQKELNFDSHRWGRVDDCHRCLACECGIWNGTRYYCPAA